MLIAKTFCHDDREVCASANPKQIRFVSLRAADGKTSYFTINNTHL